MGKGSGGAAWWAFLLLAGVLVTTAAAATETGAEENLDERREDSRPWCKKACEWQYGEDTPRRRECDSRCGHKQADADAAATDEVEEGSKQCVDACKVPPHCSPWDKQCKQQCVEACERRRQEGAGGSRDADVDEVDSDQCQRQCQLYGDLAQQWCMERCEHGRRCQRQCQHYHDWDKRQQCMRHCRHGRPGWETVAGAILAVV